MMNEYKGIINKSIINSYSEILVIDIMDDKLYKYLIKDNNVSFCEETSYMKYLDIVTVGTIADIVPLQDENRIITKIGIEKVRKTTNEGLKALIRVAGINNVDSTSISFAIAPRINATLGRAG